jgi:two-component system sensor histidine kinase UhpB
MERTSPVRRSLLRRVLAVKLALLAITAVMVVMSTIAWNVGDSIGGYGTLVLTGLALLVASGLLTQWGLLPLKRLTQLMREVDLLRPGQRLKTPLVAELSEVTEAFNQMLDQLEAERMASSRRALAAQEAERARLAFGLHDEIGQELTAVLLQLARIAAGTPGIRAELAEVAESVRTALNEVGRIVRELRPGVLEDLGLVRAVEELASSFSMLTGVSLRMQLDHALPALPRETELAIYRVAQESLTNVARHAGASHVQLLLRCHLGGIRLQVIDDGRGFDAAAAKGDGQLRGVGIRGMQERALLVGGRFAIERCRTQGTCVTLDVPLTEPAGPRTAVVGRDSRR